MRRSYFLASPMDSFALLLVATLSAAAGAVLAVFWMGRSAESSGADRLLHDPVTGLPSRAATLEALARALSLADRLQRPVTVMMVVVDGFGHRLAAHPAQTRRLEQTLAEQMKVRLRQHDVLGHWDRGRFLAVLQDADVTNALVLAEDLREQAPQAEGLGVSVSIGLHARRPSPQNHLHGQAADLVIAAERALEATDASGPGRLEIEP